MNGKAWSGVACPQGSSFGPLLWNIFQNDMAFHVTKSNLTMYADDHQLYATGKDQNTVGDILQPEAQKALGWYKNNHLLANPEKFQAFTINPRSVDKTNNDEVVRISDQIIRKTEQIKLLGVNIDDNLNFSSHISELCCVKASQKVGVLMRLRNLIQIIYITSP